MASAALFLGCATLFAPPHVLLGDGAPASAVVDLPHELMNDNNNNNSPKKEIAVTTTFFGMPMPMPKKRKRQQQQQRTLFHNEDSEYNSIYIDTDQHAQNSPDSTPLIPSAPKIERGKPISHEVKAEELYEAYQDIKEDYRLRAMSDEYADKWDVLKSSSNDDTVISMLQHPEDPSCPYVRMRAVMPGTIEDVWSFLELDNWSETMPTMDPFYQDLSILRRYKHKPSPTAKSVSMILAKKRTKRIVMYGKRDFTFVSVSDIPRSDGVWVSGTVSVITPTLPREASYVRAFQDSIAFYERLPNDEETGEPRSLLTIVCRIDLNDSAEGGQGGAIPMFFYVKTIGTSGLISMNSMRSELRKRLDVKLRDSAGKANQLHGIRDGSRTIDETTCPLIPWVGMTLESTSR